MQSYPIEEYQIGIICALPKELKAVRAVLDEEHEPLKQKDAQDHNSYVLGRIGQHNVVAAGLPVGVYGTTSAASVAKDMLRTFTELRFGLLVGIAGGIPNIASKRDIRLGDVVVSQPDATHGGVVQYDLGKLLDDGEFVRKGTFNKPPQTLLTALTTLQADPRDILLDHCIEVVHEKYSSLKEQGYYYQGTNQDQLHCPVCEPSRWWWMLWVLIVWLWPLWRCERCDNGKVIRPLRPRTTPVVHYGTIASGNTLLKNATRRDQLARDLGALCVEMEAAGLDAYPYLVIRGICDYADRHKNDVWQEYAALTAAAFAKKLLGYIFPQAAREERTVRQVLSQFDKHFQLQHEHNAKIEEHNQRQETHYHDDRHRDCHRLFGTSDYERRKNINPDAVPGTCRWVLDHSKYHDWCESVQNNLLWISADPGCGKSVLAKSLVDHWIAKRVSTAATQSSDKLTSICYFFFKDNEEQSSLSTALCAILHQLFSHQPDLIRHALPSFDKNNAESLTKKVDELWRILESAASDTTARPITCIIDALDECHEADRHLLIDLLCRSYANSTSNSPGIQGCLKWLVTSRAHDDIRGYFGRLSSDLPSIRLRGEDEIHQIRDEINLVIDHRIKELGRQLKRDIGLRDEKIEEVTQKLREMENRTYLWLYLVLDHIEVEFRRSPRPNQVKIPSLPATLNQAYEDILKRIVDPEEKQYAKVILTIIVGAPRPLTIAEMALAFDVATSPEAPTSLADLTVDFNELGEKIRNWCGLFVFIQHDQLYLIHQTAKEFLQSQNNTPMVDSDCWKHCLRPVDVAKEMAKICVIFLCLSDFNAVLDVVELQDGNRRSDNSNSTPEVNRKTNKTSVTTFFALAAQHWAEYVRPVEADLDDHLQFKVMLLYDSESERVRRWKTIVWRIWGFPSYFKMDDIHLASFNGHHLALRKFLQESPKKVNVQDSDGHTAISWAAFQGHKEIVELLLAQPGINVNLGGSLSGAALGGHKEIVELLLAQPGIDVDLRELLYEAASGGYKEIVELLLAQPGIDVNLGRPLVRAASRGHKEIIELLLAQPGIDVNLGRPLVRAASRGNKEIVELLLRHPDIEVTDKAVQAIERRNWTMVGKTIQD